MKKANTRGKGAKKGATTKKLEAAIPREFSKRVVVIEALKAKGGASLAEIMEKTGWLAHTCRGLVSTLGKTHKITVVMDAGIRRCRISK